jgi:hypothetical protein
MVELLKNKMPYKDKTSLELMAYDLLSKNNKNVSY